MAMIETAVADHGIIGDLQTAALVTTDGSIDWFSAPPSRSRSAVGLDPGHRGVEVRGDRADGHFMVDAA
jgi:hypothetical protein